MAQGLDTTVALASPSARPAVTTVTADPKVTPQRQDRRKQPVAKKVRPQPAPSAPPPLNLHLASAHITPKPMGAARATPLPPSSGNPRPVAGLDLRAPVSDRWWVDARMVDDGDRTPEPGLTVGVKLKF
jgi:hypothetical protein